MSAFAQMVRRDLLLAWKEGGTIGVALGFYLMVVTLLPLGIGPDLNLLSRIAPGVLWVALLLAALLSLGRMFEGDLEDGSLEVLATGPLPLSAIAAAKSLAHWLTTGVPLTVLAPLLGLLLNLQPEAYGVLVASMLAGTLAVSFIGAIGAALTLRARRGGLLLALLMLPLFVPTLMFGIEAVRASALESEAFLPSFLILCAISLASLVLAPLAAAAALRFQLSRGSDSCYDCMMAAKTTDDFQPKAVMSPDEQARWDALPPEEQLARLRAAIARGVDSGPAHITMDEIWARLRARHHDAKL